MSDVEQSVLSAAGLQAATIERLWWLMFWVTGAVFLAVMAGLAVALVRGRRNRLQPDAPPSSDRTLTRSVAVAVGVSIVLLISLLVASVWTGRTTGSLRASGVLTIAIIGHQWWWEIQYEDPVPSRRVVTANEFHIPTGRPVVLKVTSRDVIHSFWVPNLQGKRDLIPGYTTALWLQADRPGVFRGQCAEFCGLQHAHMALDVVAEPDAEFEQWLDAMRRPAQPPADARERSGHDVFMQTRCATCHTVQGTDAAGQVAPDLTHVATRSTLGAGTLANTPEHLAAWIRDPQGLKPGNQMPPTPLSNDDLGALVAYLETLR
jgi:cytochrome c oxidase subunit 2